MAAFRGQRSFRPVSAVILAGKAGWFSPLTGHDIDALGNYMPCSRLHHW